MKLTDQQKRYLLLIDQRTEMNWETGECNRFWVPPRGLKRDKIEVLDGYEYVDGSGVAQTLKALERRGLTERKSIGGVSDYYYRITELGHKHAQDLIANVDEIERLSRQVFRS